MTAEFAISVFITGSTLLVFLLPRLYGKFSDHPIANMLIVRGLYVIGMYLMVMNAGIVLEIATVAGYTTNIIVRYMWFWGMAGWLLMVVTVFKTLFDLTVLWKDLVKEKRGF